MDDLKFSQELVIDSDKKKFPNLIVKLILCKKNYKTFLSDIKKAINSFNYHIFIEISEDILEKNAIFYVKDFNL